MATGCSVIQQIYYKSSWLSPVHLHNKNIEKQFRFKRLFILFHIFEAAVSCYNVSMKRAISIWRTRQSLNYFIFYLLTNQAEILNVAVAEAQPSRGEDFKVTLLVASLLASSMFGFPVVSGMSRLSWRLEKQDKKIEVVNWCIVMHGSIACQGSWICQALPLAREEMSAV